MRFITARDHVLQMLILRFDDVVSGISMEGDVTRSTHLLTGHGFHICTSVDIHD
jgi:hypothetical protein